MKSIESLSKGGINLFKIPKNIKAEPKMFLGMFMMDILIIVSTVTLCLVLTKDLALVPIMRGAMILLSVLLGIFLIIKPTSNPEKRMLQILLIYSKQDKSIYHSLDPLAVKEYTQQKPTVKKEREW